MKNRPNQPRLDPERLAEMLDAATEVFIEHGFEGASTNEIASRANCSKTTFYCRFATKEELFEAVLERRMDLVFRELFDELPEHDSIEDSLTEFGSRVLRIALSPKQIALHRVVSMEATKFPRLAQRFVEAGPMRAQKELSRSLRRQMAQGRLIKADPDLMAEHFMSLLTGGPIRWKIFGLRLCPPAKAQQAHLHAAVKAFLRAYARKHTA